MDGVSSSIIGATGQASGVGEIQFDFDASVPRDQRDKAMAELSAGYRPLIDAVLSAPKASN
jgi:hypothetical protein